MNSKDIRSLQESYLSIYESQSLEEGLRAAVKRLLGGKKKEEETPEPESRGAYLRRRYNVGPERSDTSAKRQILDRSRARKERDEAKYGGSVYTRKVAKQSADAHDRYLKAGYSKYGADLKHGRGSKAAKRAAALQKEDIEWIVDALVNEGYDLSSYTWDDMYEICLEELNEGEKWIQKAIKKPGALSKQLGVPEDENIPAKKLAAAAKKGGKLGKRARLAMTLKGLRREEIDLYDILFTHLLDEGYADNEKAAEAIIESMSDEWVDVILEREDSPYEKASDAALDSRYGYGRASGDKRSFGRAANRSSAAAALRAIRRGERSGSGTSREAGADAVHQGWAKTAKTSTDQTPEKKERRAKLANTSYSNLPDDEKEKDRVSFDAVRAVYKNRNR